MFRCKTIQKDFAKISKNLARYKFENNFVGLSELCKKFKLDKQNCKKIWHSNNQFERPT